jgi:hypothetical protein
MKQMSREASELVNVGREAFRPTQADRARLMAAVAGAATLTVGAAAAAAAERSISGIWGVAHAARVLAVVLPVAAGGAYWWHSAEQPRPPAQPTVSAHQPPASVARVSAPSALALPTDEVAEQPSEPSPVPAPERSVAPTPEPSKPGDQVRQEVALLSKAQAALSRGRPQEALQFLAEHAQRFPRGALTEERVATRARTLCALGRTQEADLELKRIERLNPTSAYLARARESCHLH